MVPLRLLCFLISVYLTNSELRLMGLFGDHMVIQTPHPELGIHPTYIYGTASLNETVTISGSKGFPGPFKVKPISNIKNQIYGNWSAPLDIDTSDSSYPGPYTIYITSNNNSTGAQTGNITISDIYFGEVIFCSGQSNMEKTVAEGDSKDIEKQIAKSFPNIRLMHINNNNSIEPYHNNTGIYNNTWQIAGTNTPVGSDAVGTFSAVCWMTGRRIAAYIMNITQGYTPYIGLIEAAIGGYVTHFLSLSSPSSQGVMNN